MRDKKRDRARDEDLEEDTRPKQNSTDLPFMTVEEVSVLFLCCHHTINLRAQSFFVYEPGKGGIMA